MCLVMLLPRYNNKNVGHRVRLRVRRASPIQDVSLLENTQSGERRMEKMYSVRTFLQM